MDPPESTSAPRRSLFRVLPGAVRDAGYALLREPILRRRVTIGVAAFLVLAYAVAVVAYVLITPDVGIRCAFSTTVNYFYPDFLYPAGQEPLRPGDEILSVDGRRIESWSHFLRTRDELLGPPVRPVNGLRAEVLAEDPADANLVDGKTRLLLDDIPIVRIDYRRSGESANSPPRTVWCRIGGAPLETLVPSVLWFVVKIGLFIVGALVFWKRPQDRSAAMFFWFCTLSFGAHIGGYHWLQIVTQPVLLLVFMTCAVLLPAVSLHFYLVFPRSKGLLDRHPGRALTAIYGLPLLFLFLLASGYLEVRWLYDEGNPAAVRPHLDMILLEIYSYFSVAALWYLASTVSLVHSFRAARDATERNQVKWILYGTLASLAPIGFSLYLAWADATRFGGGAATWPMFAASVIVTAAFTISITRYRLMQLDQLVSSGFVYFFISFLAGALYYALVFAGMVLFGGQGGGGPSLGQVLGVTTTALVLLLALDLVRGRVMRVLDRRYKRDKGQLDHTLRRMSEAVEQLVDPTALGERLLHTSAELFGATRGAVYLREEPSGLYRLAGSMGTPPELTELSPGCPLVETLRAQGRLTCLAEVGPGGAEANPASRQLHFLGGDYAQALAHEGRLLGLLLLGPAQGKPLSAGDVQRLGAFAQITALALVNAAGHRTIEILNRELHNKVEKIGEQQRRILALQSQLMNRPKPRAEVGEESGQQEIPPPSPERGPGPVAEAAASRRGGGRSEMVGSSPQVQQMMNLVRKVAGSDSAVLLRGESGTGKEVLARAIHEHSPRAAHPFVKVHCAALSPGLLESELFGHVKGAFTNAIRDKKGRFEAAHGGTLFLDEIGDVSLEVQTKLLRVLQEKTFERVGSSEPVSVDVRIIAATHQDLEGLMRQGRFRQDLFYRLNVFPIALPPLRERAEDVPELAMYFLERYTARSGKAIAGLDDEALALLKASPWPGNIRQLENVIERAVVIADGGMITPAELPDELTCEPAGGGHAEGITLEPGNGSSGGPSRPPGSLPALASAFRADRGQRERREREQLVRALAAAGGNKAEAARALGMARSTLVSKLKRLGLG
jgi:transcriptional regulator with GAF, ATPase, and Fis domain